MRGDSDRLHSDARCYLLIDLHQLVREELSVLSGHDGLHRGAQHLHPVLLQDAAFVQLHT